MTTEQLLARRKSYQRSLYDAEQNLCMPSEHHGEEYFERWRLLSEIFKAELAAINAMLAATPDCVQVTATTKGR